MSLSVPDKTDLAERVRRAAVIMGVVIAALWLLEVIDVLTFHSLDQFGISPRRIEELPQIFTAPFLHFGWAHLAGNTVPLFVLGFVILLDNIRNWLVSTFTVITTSGLMVWMTAGFMSVTAGASGVVFGWLTYVLMRGVFGRNLWQVIVAVVVFAVYGGILWGVLPSQAGVSWQGHLGGAVGGVLAAWLLHARSRREA